MYKIFILTYQFKVKNIYICSHEKDEFQLNYNFELEVFKASFNVDVTTSSSCRVLLFQN